MLYCPLGAKKHGSVGRNFFICFPFFLNFLFGLIFLSFAEIYIFLKADRRFQNVWVGRKGQYNIFVCVGHIDSRYSVTCFIMQTTIGNS